MENSVTATNCKNQYFNYICIFFDFIFYFSFRSCDRPRVIDSLRGREVIDVACGGAHSAIITSNGELYTWGKGSYSILLAF